MAVLAEFCGATYPMAMECRRVPSSPSWRAALAELSGRLLDSVMRRMNASVDVDHRSTTEVARSFLNQWE